MVTAGMLHFARTDDELAAVLGHELEHHAGHIKVLGDWYHHRRGGHGGGHGPRFRGSGDGTDRRGLIQGVASHANQNKELEADEVGLRYAAAAGYNPEAAADLFERMAVEVPQTLTAEILCVASPQVPNASLPRGKWLNRYC